MFYCDSCKNEKKWPESFSKSYGVCEICRNPAICNDRPSSALPSPNRKPFTAPVCVDKSSRGDVYFLADSTGELILSTNDCTQKEIDYIAHLINTHPDSK